MKDESASRAAFFVALEITVLLAAVAGLTLGVAAFVHGTNVLRATNGGAGDYALVLAPAAMAILAAGTALRWALIWVSDRGRGSACGMASVISLLLAYASFSFASLLATS